MTDTQVTLLKDLVTSDRGVRKTNPIRRRPEPSPAETLTANLASEFLTTALFSAVTTSMVTARLQGRHLRFHGAITAYFPQKPELFGIFAKQDPGVFLTTRLTGDLSQMYRQVDFALASTPTESAEWQGELSDPELWSRLSELWQPLTGFMRLLLLVMADCDGVQSTGQMARLLEIEALVKATRYGGTPCVRTDGVVLVPGWLDRRSDRRIPVGISVRCDFGKGLQRVVLRDISSTGVGLSSVPSLPIGTSVTIELPNRRVLVGKIMWSHANTVGVRFVEALDETDQIFIEILDLRRAARSGNDD